MPAPPLARLALVALALASCGEASLEAVRSAPAPPAAPPDAPLVVFLGDSITAGLHLARDEAFPALVARRLADEGLPIRAVQAGVSGDTSAGGLRRLDWLLAQEPDVLVVELGGNDGLRGQPVAAVEENLRAIVARALAAGTRVLLLGMRLPTSYGEEYERAFAELYPRLAAEQGIACVPFFMEGVGGVSELNLPDGMHPNAAGHRRLTDNVLAALRQLVVEAER